MTILGRHTAELMDEDGANNLAGQLRRYWHARGHSPKVRVEMMLVDHGDKGRPKVTTPARTHGYKPPPRPIWVVRSNIGETLMARAA